MALVSGKRTIAGMPDSGIANVFAAVGNQPMAKVLLIEDDGETAEEITAELADRGFEVEWSANGIEGLDKARSSRPDAMIVDRLLPGMDGLTVIEALRKEQVRTPVLVLSALGAVDDRVRGLRMGGDDYLTKPFAVVELVARIEALLRRPAESRETTLRVGPLELDLIERTAKRGDRVIDLLPREFRLLEYMMQRSDQLLTRAMLLEEVWNYKVHSSRGAVIFGWLRPKSAAVGVKQRYRMTTIRCVNRCSYARTPFTGPSWSPECLRSS